MVTQRPGQFPLAVTLCIGFIARRQQQTTLSVALFLRLH
tara:strand:- start:10556 stop:10672 length:117 start_codon:yes stop_codon:yes gene_type:complete